MVSRLSWMGLSKLTIGMDIPSLSFRVGTGVGMFAILAEAVPEATKETCREGTLKSKTSLRGEDFVNEMRANLINPHPAS